MINAVGFNVNFERAVQFRKWVNKRAKDYIIQDRLFMLDLDKYLLEFEKQTKLLS